jgi:hypothetical protein
MAALACKLNRDVIFTWYVRDHTQPRCTFRLKQNTGQRMPVVRIQIDESSVTLTPFGSLIRINPAERAVLGSWTAKLRTLWLALLFR